MRSKEKVLTVAAAALVAVALAVGAFGAAAAAESVDRTLEAPADGTVVIENVAGSIQVVGWDREEVQVTGTLGKGVEKLDFENDGRRTLVAVRIPRGAKKVEGSHLTVKLPAGSRVEVSAVSADVSSEGVDGDLYLDSVSGDIEASGGSKQVEAETVSGDVRLDVTADRTRAKSVSGDLHVKGVEGEINLETVSGDCEVDGRSFDRVRATSVSGDLQFGGRLTAKGDYTFESHSGDVRLHLGARPNAEFDVSTFSGEIEVPFEGAERSKGGRGPGHELHVTVGDGGARVEISTFSGDVVVDVD